MARNLGIVPERLLEDRSKVAKFVRYWNESGIELSNVLCDRFRYPSILICPKGCGILPNKKLEEKSIVFACFSPLISAGREPAKEL